MAVPKANVAEKKRGRPRKDSANKDGAATEMPAVTKNGKHTESAPASPDSVCDSRSHTRVRHARASAFIVHSALHAAPMPAHAAPCCARVARSGASPLPPNRHVHTHAYTGQQSPGRDASNDC